MFFTHLLSVCVCLCLCVCVYVLVIHHFLESLKANAEEVWSVFGVGRRDGRSGKYEVWEENKQSLKAMGNVLPLS